MTKAHQMRQLKPLIKHVNYAGRNVRYAPLANLQITVLLNSLQVSGNNAKHGGVLVNEKMHRKHPLTKRTPRGERKCNTEGKRKQTFGF